MVKSESKAEDLFKSFKDFFIRNKINMQNIIALACDNASVMVRKNKGFQKFLKDEVSYLSP